MWLTGPAAPRHVGSSQTRARTRVPCIGRQILNHCATREAPKSFLITYTFGTLLLSRWGILATPFGYECSLTLPVCLSHSLQSTGCIFYNSFLHIQPFYLVRFLWNLLGVCHVVYWLERNSLLRCSFWETNKRKRNQYHTCLIMKIDKVSF